MMVMMIYDHDDGSDDDCDDSVDVQQFYCIVCIVELCM